MPKSKYKPIILKILDERPASLRTLKELCGKNSNIRKSLHGLLKEGIIEINGYDNTCESFKESCMMFKKVDSNYKNPIYVKRLLDNPMDGDNYIKIRKIFKTRIEQINKIYIDESRQLEEIVEKMPLKDAINNRYIRKDTTHQIVTWTKQDKQWWLDINEKIRGGSSNDEINRSFINKNNKKNHLQKKDTLEDVLKKYPNAGIWYFKKPFRSEIVMIETENYNNSTNLRFTTQIDVNGTESKKDFVKRYYQNHFNGLPITDWAEEFLFRNFVIGSLKCQKEDKEEILWNTALDLTENGTTLINLVAQIIYAEYDSEYERLIEKREFNTIRL
ncbi:MAG: hypothetical protein KO316_08820 [Methanobacterium sp.]|jgi:hypothetical protein|nr:hypothetical protein [Methanobacterium sp.]